ncbi:MAG TPA: hypothetical protein VJH67_00840 [Candidatus Paceibacterota bacterium]
MRNTIHKLKQKSESYRHKVAFFTASALTLAVLVGWAGYRGFINMPSGTVAYEETLEIEVVPSPIQNSRNAFGAAFEKFIEQFDSFKESIANVLVPFMSGIEVYESK